MQVLGGEVGLLMMVLMMMVVLMIMIALMMMVTILKISVVSGDRYVVVLMKREKTIRQNWEY